MAFPTVLYRVRLGWLLGTRFLLLTHRGRNSGKVFQTPIEAVLFDPKTQEATVISAWGENANWYRNLQAGGAVKVAIGGKEYVPVVGLLDQPQREESLREFWCRHPFEARLAPYLLGWRLRTDDQLRELAARIRVVTFKPS
jgi:deazaflavin-dependent oxidoreductase (nitroreductase family)